MVSYVLVYSSGNLKFYAMDKKICNIDIKIDALLSGDFTSWKALASDDRGHWYFAADLFFDTLRDAKNRKIFTPSLVKELNDFLKGAGFSFSSIKKSLTEFAIKEYDLRGDII